jgi:hypothetical protein
MRDESRRDESRRAGEMRAGEMEFRSSYYNIKRNRWRCTDLLYKEE